MALGPADPTGQRFVEAVLSAFNLPQLQSLLRYKGGMILENEVNTATGYKNIVEQLQQLLDQNGDVPAFVALARTEKPGNPKLKALADDLGVEPSPGAPTAPPGTTAKEFVAAAQAARPGDTTLDALATSMGKPATPVDSALEALVARRSRLIDFGRFQQRLDEIEARTCLIRTPGLLGTGFLVGPDRVLTNYHVVEDLIKGGYTFDKVVCEFDFNSDARQTVRIALAGPALASAPYSQSDLDGTGQPGPGELDYALLPLASPAGGTRGFFALDPVPRLLALNDFLFVCQHANGQQLTLALGTITDFPGKADRIRYDVTTDHGSSGSGVFTPELDLIGLHHAADPASQPKYNQAVPIWLIARDVAAKGGGA